MAVTYTLDERWHALTAGRRGAAVRQSIAWSVAVASLLGCGRGGSPLRAPPLAPGSTPEPVRYEVVVPGGRLDVRERLVRELSDSLFHVTPSEAGPVTAYNLARLVKVHVDLKGIGKDSTRVGLTGELYVGDTTRRDSISGLPERWRLITATDSRSLVLRDLARAARANRGDVQFAERTGEADGGPAERGVEGSTADPRVVAVLASTPVGHAVDVCRSASVPPGWLVLYWSLDRTRCAHLSDSRYPDEPNVMRIEREW
jgi:hypothetical protein